MRAHDADFALGDLDSLRHSLQMVAPKSAVLSTHLAAGGDRHSVKMLRRKMLPGGIVTGTVARGLGARCSVGWLDEADLLRSHPFPPSAVRLYLRFTLSYRDVEELLAERRLEVSDETIRRWVRKVGPAIARRLRQQRPSPSPRWHLDEMVVRIGGERLYL